MLPTISFVTHISISSCYSIFFHVFYFSGWTLIHVRGLAFHFLVNRSISVFYVLSICCKTCVEVYFFQKLQVWCQLSNGEWALGKLLSSSGGESLISLLEDKVNVQLRVFILFSVFLCILILFALWLGNLLRFCM